MLPRTPARGHGSTRTRWPCGQRFPSPSINVALLPGRGSGTVTVPWFYRTLRNATIDQFRRRGAAGRAIEAFARELETHTAPEPELEAEICAGVSRLATTLKPEYSEALQAIDVRGMPVKTFAEQRGLSASNAGVRVFRPARH